MALPPPRPPNPPPGAVDGWRAGPRAGAGCRGAGGRVGARGAALLRDQRAGGRGERGPGCGQQAADHCVRGRAAALHADRPAAAANGGTRVPRYSLDSCPHVGPHVGDIHLQADTLARQYSQDLGVTPPPALGQTLQASSGGGGGGNLTFFALALHDNGTQARARLAGLCAPRPAVELAARLPALPIGGRGVTAPLSHTVPPQVPVLHSDLGFNLLYQDSVPEAVIRAVPALLADFPAGLLSPAGALCLVMPCKQRCPARHDAPAISAPAGDGGPEAGAPAGSAGRCEGLGRMSAGLSRPGTYRNPPLRLCCPVRLPAPCCRHGGGQSGLCPPGARPGQPAPRQLQQRLAQGWGGVRWVEGAARPPARPPTCLPACLPACEPIGPCPSHARAPPPRPLRRLLPWHRDLGLPAGGDGGG